MAQNIQNMRGTADERTLGELFGDLSRETNTLIRQEVALAKSELTTKATRLGKDAGMLAAGGALAYAGLLALIAAAIIGLAHAITWWLSALIIGVIVLLIAGGLMWRGMTAMRQEKIAPEQTLQSLKEDAQWAKNQMT